MSLRKMALALCLMASAAPASAELVTVPYTGSYDEASQALSGDYDAIGGAADVGLFSLLIGSNAFTGGAESAADPSDAFFIEIGADERLIGARIEWGTNASDLNPIFASPSPSWVLAASDAMTSIFDIDLGGHRAESALTYDATFAPLGPGLYSVFLGNGVFALNSGAPVNYRMVFTVESTATEEPVPEPAALGLLGLGVAALGFARRRKAR